MYILSFYVIILTPTRIKKLEIQRTRQEHKPKFGINWPLQPKSQTVAPEIPLRNGQTLTPFCALFSVYQVTMIQKARPHADQSRRFDAPNQRQIRNKVPRPCAIMSPGGGVLGL
jgi:hypothetical protein